MSVVDSAEAEVLSLISMYDDQARANRPHARATRTRTNFQPPSAVRAYRGTGKGRDLGKGDNDEVVVVEAG